MSPRRYFCSASCLKVTLGTCTRRSSRRGRTNQPHILSSQISIYPRVIASNHRHQVRIRLQRLATRHCSSCSIRVRGMRCRRSQRKNCTLFLFFAICLPLSYLFFVVISNMLFCLSHFITFLIGHFLFIKMEPQLEIPQRPSTVDHERERYVSFAESGWWRTGTIHVLGPGELGKGEKRDDSAVRGSGGEECASVCKWPRARPNANAARTAPDTAAATTESSTTGPGAARTVPDGYVREDS